MEHGWSYHRIEINRNEKLNFYKHYFWLEEGWSVGEEDGEGDNSEGQNTLNIFVNIWQERTNPEEKVNQVSELVNR